MNKKKDIKLSFVDLDGTLLKKDKQIHPSAVEAIKKAKLNHGVLTVIATGRPLGYAKRVARQADFADFIISNNGGIIYDLNKKDDIHCASIPDSVALELLDVYKALSAYHFMIHTRNCTYHEDRFHGDPKIGVPIARNNSEYPLYSIQDWIEDTPNSVVSTLISADTRVLDYARILLKRIKGIDVSGNILHSYGDPQLPFMDIYPEGCSKKSAIKILTSKLKVDKQQIMAVGDGGNDLEMLQHAGIPVAMANATDEVKNAVMRRKGFITQRDNNNGGVADAYEKFIL